MFNTDESRADFAEKQLMNLAFLYQKADGDDKSVRTWFAALFCTNVVIPSFRHTEACSMDRLSCRHSQHIIRQL